MPTYEYVCQACEHEFEQFQSMSAEPLKKCPACKKPRLKRLIGTGAAVLFKGGGFYETDYRSESYKKAAEAEKKSASDSGSKAESKSESKADAKKPDAKPAKPGPKPKAEKKPKPASA